MTAAGLFLFVMYSALAGCQTTFNKYLGKTVPELNRIPISEGKPPLSVWQAKDLVFQYTCLRESDKLSLSGELALNESYEQFETLNYLHLWVHFLDSEAKILDSKLAWSVASIVAYTGQKKKWAVKSTLDLPLNATAVTFSYSGSVSQGGGGLRHGRDGTNWVFYKSPLS
jgi:hypothetical protein